LEADLSDIFGRAAVSTYETERLLLRALKPDEAEIALQYHLRNREFLEPWEPARCDDFYTLSHQEQLLKEYLDQMASRSALRFWIFKKDEPGRTIGSIGFSNIVGAVFCPASSATSWMKRRSTGDT
jgi:ribosomal-protein-alanine N-acetyltransferase